MKNDLLVFDFSNVDRSEVALDPKLPGQIAEEFTNLLNSIWNELSGSMAGAISLKLVAVELGSQRWGFRIFTEEPPPQLKEWLEIGDKALSIAERAGSIGYKLGGTALAIMVAFGLLRPLGASQDIPDKHIADTAQRIATIDYFHPMSDKIASTILSSNVDQVIITMPGSPDYLVSDEDSKSPSLIGSKSEPHRVIFEDGLVVEGSLSLRDEALIAKVGNDPQEKTLRVGELKTDQGEVLVLVYWAAETPIDKAFKPSVTECKVRGSLFSFHNANVRPIGRVTAGVRKAQLFLTVGHVQIWN